MTCVAQTELESVRKVCEWEKKRRLGQLTGGCPPDIAAILNLHPVISDTAKPAGQLATFTDNLRYSYCHESFKFNDVCKMKVTYRVYCSTTLNCVVYCITVLNCTT